MLLWTEVLDEQTTQLTSSSLLLAVIHSKWLPVLISMPMTNSWYLLKAIFLPETNRGTAVDWILYCIFIISTVHNDFSCFFTTAVYFSSSNKTILFHFRFNPQFVTLNSGMKDWHHYFLQPIRGSHVITETVNISIHMFNRGQSLSSAAGTLWTHKHTHSIVLSKQLTHPVPPFPSYMVEFSPSISVSLSLTHRHLHSHAHTHRS